MDALVKRLQNRLIHLFPIQLLLFPSFAAVQLRIVVVGWGKLLASFSRRLRSFETQTQHAV